MLHVEREGTLTAIEPDEVGREPVDSGVVATSEIAAPRPLNLDHVRAEVGKMSRTERSGDGKLQREHADTRKGTVRVETGHRILVFRIGLNDGRLVAVIGATGSYPDQRRR